MTILRLIVGSFFSVFQLNLMHLKNKQRCCQLVFIRIQLTSKKIFISCRFVSLQGTTREQEWIQPTRHPKIECVKRRCLLRSRLFQ